MATAPKASIHALSRGYRPSTIIRPANKKLIRIDVSAADSTSVRFFRTARTIRIPSSGNTGSKLARSKIQLHQKTSKKMSVAKFSCNPGGNRNGSRSFGKAPERQAGAATIAQTARFDSGPAAGVKNCDRKLAAG